MSFCRHYNRAARFRLTLLPGKWHHLVFTKRAGVVDLFINCKKVGSRPLKFDVNKYRRQGMWYLRETKVIFQLYQSICFEDKLI